MFTCACFPCRTAVNWLGGSDCQGTGLGMLVAAAAVAVSMRCLLLRFSSAVLGSVLVVSPMPITVADGSIL